MLCVDDEPHIVDGLALHLHHEHTVITAHSGAEELTAIAEQGRFSIVLSDMQMPDMNGAAFVVRVRDTAPDAIRMLPTGHADVGAAIMAVNEGQTFRFLTKPCPPEQLQSAFKAAAEQHRLITAERVLLEQTLHGSIKTLVEVLSLTHPFSFGRAMRIKTRDPGIPTSVDEPRSQKDVLSG